MREREPPLLILKAIKHSTCNKNRMVGIAMGYLSCKTESSISTAESHTSTSSSSSSLTHTPKPPIKIQEFNYKDLQQATNNFSHAKLLGRGSHGLVYKATLRGGRLVAVKKPSHAFSLPHNPNEVDNEFDILSQLHSPRLVNLLGFTNNGALHDRLLVVEFMSNGTLYDVLHTNPRPPNWGRRLKLALQTAKAIDTLHSLSPPVIHRDIKSANVLIDRSFNARLGDFGLALRCVDDYRLRSTPPAGTMGYLDPCYVTPDNVSTKTDVFSFGILLLEIISGRKALDMSNSPASIVDWAIPLIRRGKLLCVYDPRVPPPKDATVRKMVAVVAAKCVRSCRERRPSMKEVVRCLTDLSKLAPLHSWNGLANPCLMVENVGRPVQSRTVLDDDDHGAVATPLRNRGRVELELELGMRSNLMELMTVPDGEDHDHGLKTRTGSDKRVSKFRFQIGRFVERANVRSLVLDEGKDRVAKLRPNQ